METSVAISQDGLSTDIERVFLLLKASSVGRGSPFTTPPPFLNKGLCCWWGGGTGVHVGSEFCFPRGENGRTICTAPGYPFPTCAFQRHWTTTPISPSPFLTQLLTSFWKEKGVLSRSVVQIKCQVTTYLEFYIYNNILIYNMYLKSWDKIQVVLT